MTIEILDPTYSSEASSLALAQRLPTLAGATICVISNGKQGTRGFFDALELEFRERHGVADVIRLTKANYSAPADVEIMDRASEWSALIAGVGD
jgi:hypothetical protein